MPTPSSNQPGPPSPPGFSSCPDDLQPPPMPGHQTEPGRESSRSQDNTPIEGRDFIPPMLAIEHPPRRVSPSGSSQEDSLMPEESTTAEPSSRSTTMSPQPQSSVTTGSSPDTGALDMDTVKSTAAAVPAHPDQTIPEPSRADRDSPSGHRSPEQARDTWSSPGTPDMSSDDDELYSPSMGPDYPSMRAKPLLLSSYLRPGSKFHGTQQSERQVYDVSVEIKHVDMRESFLCGYLRIQGLTEDHPTLTTYFEGEIIGPKYNFFTKHDDWGACHKVDLSHWSKFSAFRPFQKQARKGHVAVDDVSQREHVFMRWKEHFLVPDHRVRAISGASFEGFYYICFNQVKGEVSGIYFHSKSEKFQQLELKHVPDRGCFSATEFR